MTAALEGGEWSAARPGRTLTPGKDLVLILQEAGWAPGPVWTGGKSHPNRDSIPDHDRGTRKGRVVSSTPRPHFTPGRDPVPILQEVGWAPGPVWTGGKSHPHRDSIPDHDRGTRKGRVVSSTPRPHFTPGRDPVPILQEVGWAPGPVWTGGKSHPHRDSIPDRPARSSVDIPTELPGPHFHTSSKQNS